MSKANEFKKWFSERMGHSESLRLDANGYDHSLHLDGINAFIFSVRDAGAEITVSGWGHDHRRFNLGQKVRLVQQDGTETRYEVINMESMMDPGDQYFMDMKFAPRNSRP